MPDFFDIYQNKHLPEDLQTVAELIGIESTRKLMKVFRGGFLYFPSKPTKKIMQEYIRNNYDGTNRKAIERFLNIKTSCFYKILNSKLMSDS